MWNGSASIIGQGATLVVTAFLSNRLGPTQFAHYAVAVSTTLTLASVAQSGLAFTATNFVARFANGEPGIAHNVASVCMKAAAMAGLAVAAVLAIFAPFVAHRIYADAELTSALYVAAIAIPFSALGLVQTGVATGLQRFRVQAMAASIFAVSLIGGTAAGAALYGAIGGAIGFAGATILRTGFMASRLFAPATRSSVVPVREIVRKIIPFALPAGIAALTLTPAVWATNALLTNKFGLYDLGLFSAAFTIKTLVAFIPMQLGTVFLPRYVAAQVNNEAAAHRALLTAIVTVGLFSAIVAGIIAFEADTVMKCFGSKFMPGANILRWLMVSVVFECTATIWSYRLASEMRMWTSVLVLTGPKDLVLVICAVALIARYGADGLAFSHLASWIYANCALLVVTLLKPIKSTGPTRVEISA